MQVVSFLEPVTDLLAEYCSCSIDSSALINSSLKCSSTGLQFEAELVYTSVDGSMTASTVIAIMEYHLGEQTQFLTIDGEELPIITSSPTNCSVPQLIGFFFAGFSTTLVFCISISGVFWYVNVFSACVNIWLCDCNV